MATVNQARRFVAKVKDENSKVFETELGEGALRSLQQMFLDRSVYVAELLQNAVDEGAKSIRFAIDGDCLVFEHDGNPFEEKDVRGLSSQGLSTKGAGTVGFMGVGFKSVYHSFETVQVSSGNWKFRLRAPIHHGERYGEPFRDWVGAVLPHWDDSASEVAAPMQCRFVFSDRLSELTSSIAADLQEVLQEDLSLLPLLARRGVRNLNWNGVIWTLTEVREPLNHRTVTALRITATSDRGEERRWVLFSIGYQPSREAIRDFLRHRNLRRKTSEQQDKLYEDASKARTVELFCEVAETGAPLLPETGRVFAVLPTGMSLPMRLHLQADWLLNAGRSDARNLDESVWHDEILAQVPRLLGAYLTWLVTIAPAPNWEVGFDALPDFNRRDPGITSWLVQERFQAILREELRQIKWLPTVDGVTFESPDRALFTPEAFRAFEDGPWQPRRLLGPRAVAQTKLGVRGHDVVKTLGIEQRLTPYILAKYWGRNGLALWIRQVSGVKPLEALVGLLAALVEASDGEPAVGWLDTQYYCIPTEGGAWITPDDARRLPTNWREVTQDPTIEAIFQRYLVRKNQLVSRQLILEAEKKGTTWVDTDARTRAEEFLDSIQGITLDDLSRAWWSDMPDEPRPGQIAEVLHYTRWARQVDPKRFDARKLISRVLVRKDTERVRLVPPDKALLEHPYAPEYLRFFHPTLPSIVPEYLGEDVGVESEQRAWATFFNGIVPRPYGYFYLRPIRKQLTDSEFRSRWPHAYHPDLKAGYDFTDHKEVGRVDNEHFSISEHKLPDHFPLEIGEPMEKVRAAVAWLANVSRDFLVKWAQPKVYYFPRHGRDVTLYGSASKLHAHWITQLSNGSWVPVKGEQRVLPPTKVLPRADKVREDAPVADVPEALVSLLIQLGVPFGTDIPAAPVVRKLHMEGPSLPTPELKALLHQAVAVAGRDARTLAELKEVLRTTPLVPGANGGADRTVHALVIVKGARHGGRTSLGNFLTEVESFEEGSSDREILDVIHDLVPFAETTTGQQALAYLRQQWKEQPDPEAIRHHMPTAYGYVCEALKDGDDVTIEWEEDRPKMRVYVTRRRRWFPVADAFYQDLDVAVLRHFPDVLNAFPIVNGRYLGTTPEQQDETADKLGLPRLSAHLQIASLVHGESLAAAHRMYGLSALRDLVREALTRSGRFDDDPDEPLSDGPPGDERLPLPELYEAESLIVRVTDGQSYERERELTVTHHQNRLYVCGQSAEFALELNDELIQLWQLERSKELSTRIGPLLPLLDSPDGFMIGLQRLRHLLGLLPALAASHDPGDARHDQADGGVGQDGGDNKGGNQDTGGDEDTDGDQDTEHDRGMGPSGLGRNSGGGNWWVGGSNGNGGGVPPHRSGGAGAGRGSYTPDTREDEIKRLRRRLKELATINVVPEDMEYEEDSGASGPTDEKFRKKVMAYEAEQGRHPKEMAPTQHGFDIESYDADGRLLRRIEVKGKGSTWRGAEVVALSRYQFTTAQCHDAAEAGWDYWLYVVEEDDDGRLTVHPLQNPARLASRYELRGGTWRWMVTRG